MAQEAVLKIQRNLHNMKEEKRKQFFNYWSCCCWSAFVSYLRKHYKRINQKRELFLKALEYAQNNNLSQTQAGLVNELRRQIDIYNNEQQTSEEN